MYVLVDFSLKTFLRIKVCAVSICKFSSDEIVCTNKHRGEENKGEKGPDEDNYPLRVHSTAPKFRAAVGSCLSKLEVILVDWFVFFFFFCVFFPRD